jgi:hypothetical protein
MRKNRLGLWLCLCSVFILTSCQDYNSNTFDSVKYSGGSTETDPHFKPAFEVITKSELGFKISAFGISQVIAAPPTTYPACNPGCSITGNSMLTSTASLHSRWPFGSYFVETEFGKFITYDNSLWSLGFGYKL